MKQTTILFLIPLILLSCTLNTKEYEMKGNWILSVKNDSTYAEVKIDSNYFDIYYNHDVFLKDRRSYKIEKDTFSFSWSTKHNKHSKCIFLSFEKDNIVLKNVTLNEVFKLDRIDNTEFTADLVANKEDIYKYEIASKNRMFKFFNIDSTLIFDYKNYLKNLDSLDIDDLFEEEIPITIEK